MSSEEFEALPRPAPAPSPRRAPHWYAAFLGLSFFDTASLQAHVLEGFEYEALVSFQDEADLTLSEVADLVQITRRTMTRRKSTGRLHADESDRLLRAARILGLSVELFEGDKHAARHWLSAPSQALGGETPLTFARTELGGREVERLIGRLEHGVAL